MIKNAKRQILFRMKLIRKLLCVFLLAFAAVSLTATAYFFVVTKDVSLSTEKLTVSENNFVLFDGENAPVNGILGELTHAKIAADEIPQKVKLAFVSTEDKRFFSHQGFDWRRIIKAFISNTKAGAFAQGASTISQQLIKNTHLSQEKTVKRKLQEWKLTAQLEKRYTKEAILEKYLNVIYFGHDCFGLASAAEFYFGKSPKDLTLAEGAILAGLVKSPNNYSPFKNPENCKRRQETVLKGMVKNGYITQAEANETLSSKLPLTPHENGRHAGYAHFVFDELTALTEKHALVLGGKVEIYTYLNQPLQEEIERLTRDYVISDKSISVLDANTHGFKASVSSVGAIRRLPASLLKPLLVYAPAMEEGLLSPATPILDEKVNYSGYSPNNFDGKFRGYISARESLAYSLNIPAVKVLESLGTERAVEYLRKMGLRVDKDDYSLALALGGMKNGYTLNELVSAYSTLTSHGQYTNGAYISSIKVNGQQIYKRSTQSAKVFSEETAYLTTDMLKTAAKDGTAKKLRSLPFEIAAKTGTCGTNKGNTDAYALSYTTRDLIGVWLGNKDNAPIETTGGGIPCNFLLQINEWLDKYYQNQDYKIEKFVMPTGVQRVALDKLSYHDTHSLSLADDCAPTEYKLFEVFHKKLIPLQKSDIFSNPSINPPILRYENGEISLIFDDKRASLYQYKIERYDDYATHSTVYQGEYTPVFTDGNLQENKRYAYTVTPVYNGKEGKAVMLPSINTKDGKISSSTGDKEILTKDWWEY